ncbi:hypothetical protein V2H45_05745 [Tumidithrix elongata RA019]|uniref:Uncharacterized protein n=1 Tax=Tumidithrix elongata BACA0141 TaxID=2716417 RepID=A0AAW9PPU7_9CYAN|nr:hypothetical protein [Tumidithrix elongata RA019]
MGTLQRELDRVENQWANLQATWRDDNHNDFVTNFLERFLVTTKQVLRDCENYEVFLNDKVKTAESLKQKLRKLAQNASVVAQIFQTVTSVVGGSAPVQAMIQSQSIPATALTSECRISPKLDDPLAKTEDPSAISKEFEPLNDWLEVIDEKKKEEREKLLNLPDRPEIIEGK